MAENLKTKTVPVIEQPKDRLYKMSIRFKGDMGDKTLDDMLGKCFPGETVSLKDAAILHIDQTVPFIPDDEALKKYADALAAGYSTGDKVVRNVRFDGYEYLYMVEPENGQDGPCAHKQKDGMCRTGASSSGNCARPCSRYIKSEKKEGK